MPLRGGGEEAAAAWEALGRLEADWLPWALSEAGLPALDEIAGTVQST